MRYVILVPVGLLIYIGIGRVISVACWNYWHRFFRTRGYSGMNMCIWRDEPKPRLQKFVLFLAYPMASWKGGKTSAHDGRPPISFWLDDAMFAGDYEGNRSEYLLKAGLTWPIRLAWNLLMFTRILVSLVVSGIFAFLELLAVPKEKKEKMDDVPLEKAETASAKALRLREELAKIDAERASKIAELSALETDPEAQKALYAESGRLMA